MPEGRQFNDFSGGGGGKGEVHICERDGARGGRREKKSSEVGGWLARVKRKKERSTSLGEKNMRWTGERAPHDAVKKGRGGERISVSRSRATKKKSYALMEEGKEPRSRRRLEGEGEKREGKQFEN